MEVFIEIGENTSPKQHSKLQIDGRVYELARRMAGRYIDIDDKRIIEDTFEVHRPEYKLAAEITNFNTIMRRITQYTSNVSDAIRLENIGKKEYKKKANEDLSDAFRGYKGGIYCIAYSSTEDYRRRMVEYFGSNEWKKIEHANFEFTMRFMEKIAEICYGESAGKVVHTFEEDSKYYFTLGISETPFKINLFKSLVRYRKLESMIAGDWVSHIHRFEEYYKDYVERVSSIQERITLAERRLVVIKNIDDILYENVSSNAKQIADILANVKSISTTDVIDANLDLLNLRFKRTRDIEKMGRRISDSYMQVAKLRHEHLMHLKNCGVYEELAFDVLGRGYAQAEDKPIFVRRLLNIVDAKDLYVSGHSERVSALCKIFYGIGAEMGIIEYNQLASDAGLFHDLGKIFFPDSIALKEGKLSDKEIEIIRSHPIDGGKILRVMGMHNEIISAAEQHHEWYNGAGGYPKYVSGDNISLIARVIAYPDVSGCTTLKKGI